MKKKFICIETMYMEGGRELAFKKGNIYECNVTDQNEYFFKSDVCSDMSHKMGKDFMKKYLKEFDFKFGK